MDELGYDTLWMAEHHFQREGYEVLPNLILLGTYLATQTRRLKFGCAFNVLPVWHPIRMAEDFAMADISPADGWSWESGGAISRAKSRPSAGRCSTPPRTGAVRGADGDPVKAFNEESWSHRGTLYTCPPRCPFRGYARASSPACRGRSIGRSRSGRPSPAASRSSHRQHGHQGHGHPQRRADHRADLRGLSREAARAGRQLSPARTSLGRRPVSGRQPEEAIRRLEPAHDERYKWFAPFGFVRYADEHGRTWGTPGAPAGVPTLEKASRRKPGWWARPREVIELIREFEARYPGLDQ